MRSSYFSKMRSIWHASPYLNLLIHIFAITIKWLTKLQSDASKLLLCNPVYAMFSAMFTVFSVFIPIPLKGGRGCLMFPSCLDSQGCHLIPLSYLLSCFFLPSPLALSVLSFFSANGPFSRFFSRILSNIFR